MVEIYQERLQGDQLVNPVVLAKDFYDFMWEVSDGMLIKTQKVEFSDVPDLIKHTITQSASQILQKYFVISKEQIKNEH